MYKCIENTRESFLRAESITTKMMDKVWSAVNLRKSLWFTAFCLPAMEESRQEETGNRCLTATALKDKVRGGRPPADVPGNGQGRGRKYCTKQRAALFNRKKSLHPMVQQSALVLWKPVCVSSRWDWRHRISPEAKGKKAPRDKQLEVSERQ